MLRWMLWVGVWFGIATPVVAQTIYDTVYRPEEARYHVLESTHFEVIFQAGMEADAREVAAILEADLPGIQRRLGVRRRIYMPVVLNGFNDRSNGFVRPFPFKQEIEGGAIRSISLSPRFHTWYQTVAPHELAHAAHAEFGTGFGFGGLIRPFSPDLARLINLAIPPGLTEGIAVYHESLQEEGAGRLHHAPFTMQFQAAMLSDRPWNLSKMWETPAYSQPGNRFYIGGAHLVDYLAQSDSLRFFQRMAERHYVFPFLGSGFRLWQATKQFPYQLNRTFQQTMREAAQAAQAARGQLSEPTRVAAARGLVHRRPLWVGDQTILVWRRGYNVRPGFYEINVASGEQRLVASESITEDFHFSLTPDQQGVLFARYVQDPTALIKATADLFLLDRASGKVQRQTESQRLFSPVSPQAGQYWAIQNTGQYTQWVQWGSGVAVQPLTRYAYGQFKQIAPSPDGQNIAVLLNARGFQGIFRADEAADGTMHLQPWVGFAEASVFDVAWSPDSRFLCFTADRAGVLNIYALDVLQDRLYQLTNAAFGAMEPSISPDGSQMAYIDYQHEQYNLVSLPFLPTQATEVARSQARHGDQVPWEMYVTTPAFEPYAGGQVKPYRSLKHLRPRSIYPIFDNETVDDLSENEVDLGWAAGLGIAGTDPLQQWTYQAEGFYQHHKLWGDVRLAWARFPIRPELRVYDEPSSVLIRTATGVQRVGMQERGVALQLARLHIEELNVSQTFSQVALKTEYFQQRFFDKDGTVFAQSPGLLALEPTLVQGYQLQQNVRDIVPNRGVWGRGTGRMVFDPDIGRVTSWGILADGSVYLPWLHQYNIGLQLNGGVLRQNQGNIYDLDFFMPRGHEQVFLGEGTFWRYGLTYTQPLWYIDKGFFVLPFYFRALYAYGFAEALQQGTQFDERISSVGAGLGLEMRFFYFVDFAVKVGVAYRARGYDGEDRWSVVYR